jgi:hypothetical protein
LTFDYAYHQYGDISENTTHFFSIGYKGSDTTSLASLGQQMRKSQVPQVNVVPKPIFKTFTDVPAGYWAKQPIDYISALKIMSGYPDGSFRPDQPISKGDLVNTLNKAKWYNNKGPAKEYFPKGYNPSTKVTRAEAAKVFADYAGLYQKDKVSQQVFPDVEIEDSSSPAIAASKEAGFFEFLAGKNFGPDEYVTRAEAAEMLSKVPFIKEKIKNLISGE